jgi:hypothetical protein
LRYEDLVADPQGSLGRLAAQAQRGVHHDLGFLDGHRLTVGDNHMVDGNPVRFTRDAMALVVDDEWRRRLAPGERRATTAMTWPLLRRYGYVGSGAPTARGPMR